MSEQSVLKCPCCGKPMRVFDQPSMFPGRPSHKLADCQNPNCDLFMVTRTVGVHETLTAQQIESYGRARRAALALEGKES